MTFPTSDPIPDPYQRPDFYEGVPAKRLIAWVIDVAIILLIAAPLLIPIALTSILIWPMVMLFAPIIALTGFLYRWATLAGGSATWGMRFMAIGLRSRDGLRLDGLTAFLHVAGTAFCFGTTLLQLASIALMVGTARGQGLPDLVLGTVMLNRAA